jgi:hypothetical protein
VLVLPLQPCENNLHDLCDELCRISESSVSGDPEAIGRDGLSFANDAARWLQDREAGMVVALDQDITAAGR